MKHLEKQNGQAVVMVTFALAAMCGLLGLSVDLGWSYFVKRNAQTAADAAALAAATSWKNSRAADCGNGGISCTSSPTQCSSIAPSSSLHSACLYAQQTGFTDGSGNVAVTVDANVTSPAPTVPGVKVSYWVTVRVSQPIAQLFSAVLGNRMGVVSARATAAVTDITLPGSLYLLNRENDSDQVNNGDPGIDLTLVGGANFTAPGGVSIASNRQGTAAFYDGSSVTDTPINIRGQGTAAGICSISTTQCPFTNGYPDGPAFWDPTAGKAQPPLVTIPTPIPIEGGVLPALVMPGLYYAVTNGVATGAPLTFQQGSTTFESGTFGTFVFVGGLQTAPSQSITFGPGEYVFAGTTGVNPALSVANETVLKDRTIAGLPQTDAGELFLFTDTTYPGLPQIAIPSLSYGQSGFTGGTSSSITLHGLNDSGIGFPSSLKEYAPFLLWQDRRDSACSSSTQLNIPCTNPQGSKLPAQMNISLGQKVNLYGAIYQPRGGWINLFGASNRLGNVQIITGALYGSGTATLGPVVNPIKVPTVALIE